MGRKKVHRKRAEDHDYDPMQDVVNYRRFLQEQLDEITSGAAEVYVSSNSMGRITGAENYDLRNMRAHIESEIVRLAKDNLNYFYAKKASVEASGPDGGPIPVEEVRRVVIDPKGD